MASKAVTEAYAELDALLAKKAELLAQVEPLEREKEHASQQRNHWNEKAEDLAARINAITHPHMGDITARIRILSMGLSGKKRPEPPKPEGEAMTVTAADVGTLSASDLEGK